MSQEQEKIQKYIIRSAPYGQLSQELGKIAPLETDPPKIGILCALEEYNQEHLALVQTENNSTFMIMAPAKLSMNLYADQLNNRSIMIDHLKGKVVRIQQAPEPLPAALNALLKALDGQIKNYGAKYYRQPFGSLVYVDQKTNFVFVGFTAKNIQMGNFYTGEWVSKWKITNNQISGSVNVRAHFFQNGNVQFQQKKDHKQEFQLSQDPEQNAKIIAKMQQNLNQVYDQMSDGFFKHLRRVLPVHKVKMVWNVNSINMNRNLINLKQ